MSGTFRPEQNAVITATDDPDLARQHGLTSFNKATGQFEAPRSDAGTRDGDEAHEAQRAKAAAEGDEAQRVEQEQREADERARAEAERAAADAATPKKSTGSKAASGK